MEVHVFDGYQARWSPNGKEFAFVHSSDARTKDTLCVMNVDGTNLRAIVNYGLDPRWSPDGDEILCSWIGRLILVDPKNNYMGSAGDRTFQFLSGPHSVHQGDFDWSPDGRKIAFIAGSRFRDLYVVDADGTNLRCFGQDDDWRKEHLSWSPDGQWIVCEGIRGIELFSISNGSRSVLFPHGIYPSWSLVGDRIAFYTYDGIYSQDERPIMPHGIHLFDYGSHKLETLALGRKEVGRTSKPLSWSPNGEFIAFEANQGSLSRGGSSAVYLLRIGDQKLVKLVEGWLGSDSPISWSPDSSKVAICLLPDFHTCIIEVSNAK